MNPIRKFFPALFFIQIIAVHFHSAQAQRVGLVLSGGGARGLAHIGVIKALEENNIPIDFIAGTSAGAIVGAMYAQGLSPAQMDSLVRTEDFYHWATGEYDEDYSYYFRRKEENAAWINLKFSLDSIVSTSLPTNIINSVPVDYALMEAIAPSISKAKYNFDSLFVPFRCVASDIENKKTIIFRHGDLAQAVRASAAFPFYFKPIYYDGKILYDGGLYNNFPADVMLNEFQPDIIIGVNAGGSNAPIAEENIISQIRTMMTIPTSFELDSVKGIVIEPYTEPFALFDFTRPAEVIREGYASAMKKMETIKSRISRRVPSADVSFRRKEFTSGFPIVMIDKIVVSGVSGSQSEYIRQVLKPGSSPMPLARLKPNYFQLAVDDNIKNIFPRLVYNDSTSLFDLHLRVARQKDLITQFGGNISSRPISEAYVGMQYNFWSLRSYSFNFNFYFGKLYSSGQLRIRMDVPSSLPYFLETDVTVNQWDFYRSSTELLTDIKPSYLLKSDWNYGLNFGLPARNKGKVITSISYIKLSDKYYQTPGFQPASADTADVTRFNGFTSAVNFERNTMDRKQYASRGTFLSVKFRYVTGKESAIPGSTAVIRDTTERYHTWIQAKLIYDNYYKRRGRIKLGFYAEAVYSNQPFFTNYTSTILTSPSFEPLQETKTLFLPNFRAHIYGGAGLKNIISLTNNLDFRIEGYLFQPYQAITKNTDNLKAEYGQTFERRFFIGSAGAVFHSPIGPVALFLNYYDDRKDPFSLLFHIGYIIFNKGAID